MICQYFPPFFGLYSYFLDSVCWKQFLTLMKTKLNVVALVICALVSYKDQALLFSACLSQSQALILRHCSSRASPGPDSLTDADTAHREVETWMDLQSPTTMSCCSLIMTVIITEHSHGSVKLLSFWRLSKLLILKIAVKYREEGAFSPRHF